MRCNQDSQINMKDKVKKQILMYSEIFRKLEQKVLKLRHVIVNLFQLKMVSLPQNVTLSIVAIRNHDW